MHRTPRLVLNRPDSKPECADEASTRAARIKLQMHEYGIAFFDRVVMR